MEDNVREIFWGVRFNFCCAVRPLQNQNGSYQTLVKLSNFEQVESQRQQKGRF